MLYARVLQRFNDDICDLHAHGMGPSLAFTPHYGAGRTIELVGVCEDLYAIAETAQLSKVSALAEGIDTGSA
jgi:hypothetical protein